MARKPNRAVKTAPPRRYAIREKAVVAHKLTMELAEALAEETLRLAWEMGLNTVSAVVDEGGALKAFRRPDRSNLGCVDFAILKARCAVHFNTATHAHYPAWSHQPETVAALAALPGFTVEGGGVPIRLNGELIGGIGVSGARNWREDVEVIAKAFKKFGLDPIAESAATPAPTS
jgi:uncharacterized protein GlcG (DUF336 family)